MTIQNLVREMCQAFGQDVHNELHKPDQGVRGLRLLLLSEEFREYMDAEKSTNPVDIADALGDMLVVIYGTAAAYGIDLDAVVREIHASNMTKVQPDGSVLRSETGKILKPDTYRPPNLAPILGDLGAWSA